MTENFGRIIPFSLETETGRSIHILCDLWWFTQ